MIRTFSIFCVVSGLAVAFGTSLAGAQSVDAPVVEAPETPKLETPELETPKLETPEAVPELRRSTPDETVPPFTENPFEDIDPIEKPPLPFFDDSTEPEAEVEAPKDTGPDYSQLSPTAERAARLDALFEKLAAETVAEDAELIAEEIWAIWLDSGSETVNFILRRGTKAQKGGDQRLARRLYDQVTILEPDYAEGWSRSGRLALEEEDMGRALVDTTEALIREPRHFYALWTLGNIFEHLGRNDDALEVYREANRLYPELKAVKDRVDMMRDDVEGDVL